MTKVFTYHSSLPGSNPEHDVKLLLLWKECWSNAGYDPIVLNEYIASEHSLYKPFCRRIEELPTVNTPLYERACYVRWLAMAQVGGGIMTDHDVMIYDGKEKFAGADKITLYQAHVPCLASGSRLAYEKVVEGIMEYKVTEKDLEARQVPHVSDMYMFYREGIPFHSKQTVKSFNEPGWLEARFVHFSNSSMHPVGKFPRHIHIPELRDWRKK